MIGNCRCRTHSAAGRLVEEARLIRQVSLNGLECIFSVQTCSGVGVGEGRGSEGKLVSLLLVETLARRFMLRRRPCDPGFDSLM